MKVGSYKTGIKDVDTRMPPLHLTPVLKFVISSFRKYFSLLETNVHGKAAVFSHADTQLYAAMADK